MPLRRASTEVKQIPLDEDGAFIGVVKEISKGDFNKLVDAMPEVVDDKKGLTPQQGMAFSEALFEIFVRTWSLDGAPTVDEYRKLEVESATAVDAALVEHFSSLTPDAPKGGRRKT